MAIFFTTIFPHGRLFINEFMAVNVLARTNTEGGDEHGFQIHNFGNGPVQSSPRYTESVTREKKDDHSSRYHSSMT